MVAQLLLHVFLLNRKENKFGKAKPVYAKSQVINL